MLYSPAQILSKMSQYDYAKDKRSDEEYEHSFKIGKANQLIAAEQFVRELRKENPGAGIKLYEIEDSDFKKTGTWEYNPDFEIITESKPVFIEVKVTHKNSPEIDIKKSQVDHLAKDYKNNGFVLYAKPTQYALISPSELVREADIATSERFGGKEVYRLKTDKIAWKNWSIFVKFEAYS